MPVSQEARVCLIVCIYDYVTMFICLHMGRVHIASVNSHACTYRHIICALLYICIHPCVFMFAIYACVHVWVCLCEMYVYFVYMFCVCTRIYCSIYFCSWICMCMHMYSYISCVHAYICVCVCAYKQLIIGTPFSSFFSFLFLMKNIRKIEIANHVLSRPQLFEHS